MRISATSTRARSVSFFFFFAPGPFRRWRQIERCVERQAPWWQADEAVRDIRRQIINQLKQSAENLSGSVEGVSTEESDWLEYDGFGVVEILAQQALKVDEYSQPYDYLQNGVKEIHTLLVHT